MANKTELIHLRVEAKTKQRIADRAFAQGRTLSSLVHGWLLLKLNEPDCSNHTAIRLAALASTIPTQHYIAAIEALEMMMCDSVYPLYHEDFEAILPLLRLIRDTREDTA